MEQEEVENHLIEILQSIQSDCGYDIGNINSQTRPLIDLEGFDSELELRAISMLADKLQIYIPNEQRIFLLFLSEDCKRLLSIKESAALVCEIISSGENQT